MEKEIKKIIKIALIKIGMHCELDGFMYLVEAIEMLINEPEKRSFCKIYKNVGEKFNIKAANVERSIRNLIETTYVNEDYEKINRLFGMEICTIHDKLTAGRIISLMAEYYNLGLYED